MQSVKDLQSSDTLAVPTSRLSTVGDRAFPAVAARVRNALHPDVILSTSLLDFKRLLKTELFARSFPEVTPTACDCAMYATE